jgi:hypothetical protein
VEHERELLLELFIEVEARHDPLRSSSLPRNSCPIRSASAAAASKSACQSASVG